ncbi:hypothetical protein AB0K89_28130 [Streptomyces cinnamoneus]|uniref:hypothetical protein n=1 Tax=Streptomyces cinnamoneus TaxID=53446 RepID=UPI003425AAB3
MHRLALFDLDGTLADRQLAFSDAVIGLCRTHSFTPDIEHWLLTELADRANPSDFIRLHDTFDLVVPGAQLWQEHVDLMAAAVTCRP